MTNRRHASNLDGTNPKGTVFKRILIGYNGSAEGKHMLSPSTKGLSAFVSAEVLDTSPCAVLVIRPPA